MTTTLEFATLEQSPIQAPISRDEDAFHAIILLNEIFINGLSKRTRAIYGFNQIPLSLFDLKFEDIDILIVNNTIRGHCANHNIKDPLPKKIFLSINKSSHHIQLYSDKSLDFYITFYYK
jgi:hypothetical protein